MNPYQTNNSFTGYQGPELTATTQGLTELGEVARLRQLVKTKDQIIASLRSHLEREMEIRRDLMRLL